MKGKLITFEGCEGAGKSTQLRFLKEYCAANGIDAVFTREPGGTDISEKIRTLILDAAHADMSPVTELLLYAAARSQHVAGLIRPALIAGKLVICDRFTDSTLAYQGYARGLSVQDIKMINRVALSGITPDLTVFLDVPPHLSFTRKGGADIGDRLENETLAFHQRVYEGYHSIIKEEPQRFVSICTAALKKEQTFEKIVAALRNRGLLV